MTNHSYDEKDRAGLITLMDTLQKCPVCGSSRHMAYKERRTNQFLDDSLSFFRSVFDCRLEFTVCFDGLFVSVPCEEKINRVTAEEVERTVSELESATKGKLPVEYLSYF